MEKPVCLKLKTTKVVSNLSDSRNTLTQRIFADYTGMLLKTSSIKFNIDCTQNGDVVGPAVFHIYGTGIIILIDNKLK
jgi:hypothetical protein